MMIFALILSLPGLLQQSFLHCLELHYIVSACDHPVAVFKLEQAGIPPSTNEDFTGSQISFRQACLHAPDILCHG